MQCPSAPAVSLTADGFDGRRLPDLQAPAREGYWMVYVAAAGALSE